MPEEVLPEHPILAISNFFTHSLLRLHVTGLVTQPSYDVHHPAVKWRQPFGGRSVVDS